MGVTGSLIMGDFNLPTIDWNTLRCGSGHLESQMVHLCETTPLHQVVRFPTRFRESNRPSLLDLAFVQKPEEVWKMDSLLPLGSSDHCVIRLVLNTGGLNLPPPRWVKQYHRADPQVILLQARALDWMPHEGDDAEVIWTRVRDNIRLLDSQFVPWVRINPMRKPRWMSPAVRRARDDKRRSWVDWRRCPTTANWERFARDRNRLQTLIRRAPEAADLGLSNNLGKGNPRL